jgi:Flp pilus assembly pilin Flp
MDPRIAFADNDGAASSGESAGRSAPTRKKEHWKQLKQTEENGLRFWEQIRDDEAQGVSEYAMLLVLLVLIVVAAVHALGMNAQQVIDRVNTALNG